MEHSMKPTPKAPEIERAASTLANNKNSREDIMKKEQCAFCDTPNLNFRDELSRKEYRISQLCQDCQDKVFKA